MMAKGEKSLIFVRRVASANELERRMLDKWERLVFEELKTKWKKTLSSKALLQLINSHIEYTENRALAENLDDIFRRLLVKIVANPVEYPLHFVNAEANATANATTNNAL
jgi:hypothetical protein